MKWSLPANFEVVYENVGDELVVGGVFMHLLIKQTGWVFRKPKEFLVAAMEKYLQLMVAQKGVRNSAHVELLTDALTGLFRAQNELVNQIAGLGHINKIVACMPNKSDERQGSLLRMCNEFAESPACIRAFATTSFMGPVKEAMQGCTRSALAPALEMISKCVDENTHPVFVAQAVESKLVDYMLELLKGELDTIESGAAAKAHCVSALKMMSRDLSNGDKVEAVLKKAPWWATYKDQRHDLFITTNTTAGYLTGPTATVAGYLMSGSANSAAISDTPPELDVPDDKDTRIKNVLGDD